MTFTGKTCLITGASSGLGFAVAKRFADEGALTVILCRNQERGEKAVLELKKETPDAAVELMICDLASMSSIQNFIREFRRKYTKLDILFNNAAVMKQKRTITGDGFEMMFQTNYLAPVILTTSLLDVLKKSSAPRVINIAVPAEKLRVDFEDLQFSKHYSAFTSFFTTKLYLLFSSLELAQRLQEFGITLAISDPGPFKSSLVRELPWPGGLIKNLFSSSVDKAADNIMYVAGSDEAKTKTGKIFVKRKERHLTPYWNDINTRERLWSITESLLKDI